MVALCRGDDRRSASQWGIILRCVCLWLAVFGLTACSTNLGPGPAYLGKYNYWGSGWYAGYVLRLDEEKFTLSFFTDVVGVAPFEGGEYTITGDYSVEGKYLKLHHEKVPDPVCVMLRFTNRYVILTPEQYKSYLKTKVLPEDGLYQQRGKRD